MTHIPEDDQRVAELNATFLLLNDKGKDSALTILRTLGFAQSVMGTDTAAGDSVCQRNTGLADP